MAQELDGKTWKLTRSIDQTLTCLVGYERFSSFSILFGTKIPNLPKMDMPKEHRAPVRELEITQVENSKFQNGLMMTRRRSSSWFWNWKLEMNQIRKEERSEAEGG